MPTPRFSSKAALLLAMVVMVSISGCVPWARGIRTIDESVTDWRDFVWGKRAFYQRYGTDASGPFMDGFLEGYHDMLQGGDGCLPVVPPRRYWNWKYQSAGGQGAVNDWFEGYRAGVAAAKEDGLANISCVPISYQYNGMSSVPIEGIQVEEEWVPFEGEVQPDAIPIPPSIEPGKSGNKGAMFFDSKSKSLVRPASAKREMNPLPLATSGIEVSPMMRIPTNQTVEPKKDTPLGTAVSRTQGLPPIVSVPSPGQGLPVSSRR